MPALGIYNHKRPDEQSALRSILLVPAGQSYVFIRTVKERMNYLPIYRVQDKRQKWSGGGGPFTRTNPASTDSQIGRSPEAQVLASIDWMPVVGAK